MAKILIIDDEPDIVEFQKAFLSRRKHEVITATNSSEALEMIRANTFEIVFCDVRLDTDSAGLKILEETKKLKPQVQFFLITGLIDKEIHDKGMALGAREILTKPISNAQLEQKVQEALA